MTMFSRLSLAALLTTSLAAAITPTISHAATTLPCNFRICPPPPGTNDTPDDSTKPGDPFDWPTFINETGDSEEPTLKIDCSVRADSPTTDDLWLLNVGSNTLPAGTIIQYRVAASGDRGSFQLKQDIPAGKARQLPSFLSEAVPVGSDCAVRAAR